MSGTTSRRRHSPAVYRRRRLAVLLIAVVVVAGLVWLFVAQPWRSVAASGDAPAPSPAATSASPTPSVSTPVETEAPPADGEAAGASGDAPSSQMTPTAEGCLPGSISVEAVTNQQTYASGQNPELSIKLTNTSGVDCTLDVGTSSQSFTISSGSDVWWRSTDCQSEPSSMIVLLKAGQEVSSAAPLTWDRTRSSTSSCQGQRPAAPGGGATYHLSVAIAGIPSANTAAFQLY
jgi:cytoskeletal protein RodZ